MKKTSFLAGALLVAAPVLAILPGCGGGGSGVTTPTSTPVPTVTGTPTGTTTGTPTGTTTGTPSATTTGTPNATTTGTPGATATSTTTPTPTVTPTSTPGPTNTPIAGQTANVNLTFTPSSDSNFQNNIPINSATLNYNSGSKVLDLFGQGSRGFDSSYVVGTFGSVSQGKVYTSNSDIRISNSLNSGATYTYSLTSGTITVTQLTGTNATLTYRNAVFSPLSGVGTGKGTVTVNGTISGPFSSTNN